MVLYCFKMGQNKPPLEKYSSHFKKNFKNIKMFRLDVYGEKSEN
ncbi:MAG: hypothetical protein ACD_73C00320G0001 [uncultured bacterium]|nr:MAG: hypothetical protein ACD_73C00320G0001 [uncultured bacterium]